MMKKITLFCLLLSLTALATLKAQNSPVGVWKTIDDNTGEAKSHVEIYQKDGKFYGKVLKLLLKPMDTVCDECPGDKKGKPVVGMDVLWDIEPYDDYWSNGEIMDPENGKTYSCSIWMEEENELKVRGYLGFSLLGRTQKWYRITE